MNFLKRELNHKELLYGRIVINFANKRNQGNPEDAIKYLNDSVRLLTEIPANIRIKKRTPKQILSDQNDLIELFEELIQEDHLYDVSLITDYVFCYNMTCRPMVDVQSDGSIAEYPMFYKEKNIECYSFIAYCLMNFLKADFDQKKKYIVKCKLCKEFFIPKKTGAIYCPVCSKKSKMTKEQRRIYDAERKETLKRIRKDKLTREEETQLERMVSNGYTRENALAMIMVDREIATEKI